jgi:hypothetical protein
MKVSINHPTDRPNLCEVTLGSVTVVFSYQTPIAFWGDDGLVIRQNDWGPTTGKHLNHVSTTRERVDGETFARALEAQLNNLETTFAV